MPCDVPRRLGRRLLRPLKSPVHYGLWASRKSAAGRTGPAAAIIHEEEVCRRVDQEEQPPEPQSFTGKPDSLRIM